MLEQRSRKKGMPALPELRPNFEAFSEYLSAYFSCVDETGIIYYVNLAFAKALGYKQQELVGRHAYEIIREYNSDGIFQWNRIEEVLANPVSPPMRELELCCKNGTSLWVEMRERLWTLPEKPLRYSLAISIDVTSRRNNLDDTKQLQAFHFVSAFMNNAVKRNFEFAEVSRYLESTGIEIKTPFVALFLKPNLPLPCSPIKTGLTIDWNRWVIPVVNFVAADHHKVLWEAPQGLALLLGLAPDVSVDDQINAVIADIIKQLKTLKDLAEMVVGVSDVWKDPSCTIATPVYEARESLHWGSIMNPGKNCYRWKNLGIGQLLLKLTPTQAKCYFEDRLGPLLALPDINRAELLPTLGEILSARSVSESAQRMHVHPKTIAYRRTRLEKLLNVDFDDPAIRTELFVALRLFQIHKDRE